MIVTHPFVLYSVVVMFAFIGSYFAYSLYQPLFHITMTNCTQPRDEYGNRNGTGTFLARNSHSLAFNYATRDGATASSNPKRPDKPGIGLLPAQRDLTNPLLAGHAWQAIRSD